MFDPLSKPGSLVRRLHQVSVRLFESHTTGLCLSAVQFGALQVVAGNSGIDQASLTVAADVDRTTAVRVVDRLVELGLVTREVCDQDRRVRRIHITKAGLKHITATTCAADLSQAALLAPLDPEEQKEFMRLLRHLVVSHTEMGNALHDAKSNQLSKEKL